MTTHCPGCRGFIEGSVFDHPADDPVCPGVERESAVVLPPTSNGRRLELVAAGYREEAERWAPPGDPIAWLTLDQAWERMLERRARCGPVV